jgi:hypothetical protein
MQPKIKVLRQSGQPVRLEFMQAIQAAENEAYDKVIAKFKIANTMIMDADLSVRTTRLLQRISRSISKRYPAHDEWSLPVSPEEWSEVTKQYGPVAVGLEGTTGELFMVILDAGLV